MSDKELKNTVWRGRFFRYAPLILWIAVIFIASSTQGSMSNTSRFIRPFLEWLFPNTTEEILTIYHGYIRKFAHFAEYAALAFFAYRAFSSSANEFLQKYWFFASLLLIFLVASIDEINQSFLAGRTGSFWDVLLDTAGGLTMLIFVYFIKIRYNAKQTR